MSAQGEYLDKLIQTQGEEIERLKVWRVDVTSALHRAEKGGTHYADVAKYIRDLVRQYDELADAVAGPDRESIEDRDKWTHEALVEEADNLRDNGPDVPVVRLHELLKAWRLRQEDIHADYWKDQGAVSILETAITEVETVIRDNRKPPAQESDYPPTE